VYVTKFIKTHFEKDDNQVMQPLTDTYYQQQDTRLGQPLRLHPRRQRTILQHIVRYWLKANYSPLY
jgi:hypothetical protein